MGMSSSHTRASVKESKGYPPPEKFWIAAPPPQEGDSLAKYSPLLEKFEPKIQRVPPMAEKFWKILENF